MARYYRRQRYRKSDDGIGGLAGLMAIGFIAYAYSGGKSFIAQHPYIPAVLIACGAAIILIVIAVTVRRALRRKHLYDAITMSSVDTMSGLEFERFLADLLKKRGCTDIRLTEKYDLGVDIIAKKDGVTWGIQAKRYNSPAKADAVRQAYTGLNRYKCDRAMVITNNTFSRQARMLASDNNVVLVDRNSLSAWIYDTNQKKSNRGAIL
ncbi:restriction endonuclease [Candidatus Saccharibacteria bacterium]|nr:restriction endonuclease [Candidatus Saccharibacteria bacterium]